MYVSPYSSLPVETFIFWWIRVAFVDTYMMFPHFWDKLRNYVVLATWRRQYFTVPHLYVRNPWNLADSMDFRGLSVDFCQKMKIEA